MGDHTEALQIDFDPAVVGYDALLARFWQAHDPTKPAFCTQYRAAVWPHDEPQMRLAMATGEEAARRRQGVLRTHVAPLERFYRAEDYHQKYRLRRDKELASLVTGLYVDDRAMVDSTRAARINGYLRGFGGRAALQRLLPALALGARGDALLMGRVNG